MSPRRTIARSALIAMLVASGSLVRGDTVIREAGADQTLLLNREGNYSVDGVKLVPSASPALVLSGRLRSVEVSRCSFGPGSPRSAAFSCVEAVGASIDRLVFTQCDFRDAEQRLLSLRDGRFSLVRLDRCLFQGGDADGPAGVVEFANVDCLELADNDYRNVVLSIHPSVRRVVIRGSMPNIVLQSPQTSLVCAPAPTN